MQEEITKELVEHCQASYVKVINNSHKHHHHKMSPGNNHSHFQVIVCSDLFTGMSLVKRHKYIYSLCETFITRGVHALAIEAYSTDEWRQKHG